MNISGIYVTSSCYDAATRVLTVSVREATSMLAARPRSKRHLPRLEPAPGTRVPKIFPHLPLRPNGRSGSRLTVPSAATYSILREGDLRRAYLRVLYPDTNHWRPTKRADCEPGGANEARPCPYVGCKYHLAVSVNPSTGAIKFEFPHLDLDEMQETCLLDVVGKSSGLEAEQDDPLRDGAPMGHAVTLARISELMNIVRERVRQIEADALAKIREAAERDIVMRELHAASLEVENARDAAEQHRDSVSLPRWRNTGS